MELFSIKLNENRVDFEYLFGKALIKLILPQPLEPNSEAVIEMDYELNFEPEHNNEPSIMSIIGFFDEVLVLDSFYPVIPVYDHRGWNISQLPRNGDKTFLDMSYYRVLITAPKDLTILATGSKVEQSIEGGSQLVSFAAGPCRDFFIAASEDFSLMSTRIGETDINSYVIGLNPYDNNRAMDISVRAVEFYNDLFGTYPYTELDIVSLPLPNNILGIEYPAIIGINPSIYSQSSYLEATIAHEVCHQWFYNIVGNNQVNEPWLDEALVQYLTGLYFLDTYGEEGWRGFYESWVSRWQRIDNKDIPIGMPSDYYSSGEYGPIVYGRGPIMMDEIAEKIGRDTFLSLLQDYYNNNKWKIAYAFSFCEMAQRACNCDFNVLFDSWLY